MKIGVVGLPNVGKSTLFNALTKNRAESSNYPFTTIDPNIGIVKVSDERVEFLADAYKPKKITYATIEFVDIAGLVRGAASGEGLGNKFLGHIREVDAIVHVVRCFENQDIIHVDGGVDPIRDIETINLELMLADDETVARRQEKLKKSKSGTELGPMNLLMEKPVIYLANLNEEDMVNPSNNPHFNKVAELAKSQGNKILGVCAKIEEELSQISDDSERAELMDIYGLRRSGLECLIAVSYQTLGLISFLTAGEAEVRAWTINEGIKAPQAAGKIHTDFERGFIRAEVVAFNDFKRLGGLVKARESGKLKSEGKDYVMKDGDIVLFRFNV